MSSRAYWINRPSAQPFRVFVIVLLTVSVLEGVIMLAFGALLSQRHPFFEAALDTFMLTTMLAPALWLAVVRPLQHSSTARGRLLAQMFDVQENERARIARDLHDELGQQFTAILLSLRSIEQADNLDSVHERAHAAVAAANAGLTDVRRIARGLRPVVLEELGLVPAVERLCEEIFSAHGTRPELSIRLQQGIRFSPAVEMAVFRVLQEALTNCVRHSSASRVRVELSGNSDAIRLTIDDDGCGFEPGSHPAASLGLHGMRERVELLDGRFTVRSSPGAGTTISAEFFPKSVAS